jgi:hypothetical protein
METFVKLFSLLIFVMPFPLAAWMSVSFARRRGTHDGLWFGAIFVGVLSLVYIAGIGKARECAREGRRTAATTTTVGVVLAGYGLLTIAAIGQARRSLQK